jgi:hypothetical protein
VASRAASSAAFSTQSVQAPVQAVPLVRLGAGPTAAATAVASTLPTPANVTSASPTAKALAPRLTRQAPARASSTGGAPADSASVNSRDASSVAAPSANELGPSALIEKLIEHRH